MLHVDRLPRYERLEDLRTCSCLVSTRHEWFLPDKPCNYLVVTTSKMGQNRSKNFMPLLNSIEQLEECEVNL